uniref:Uncharacterized protein n=1 Tax=Arundo donax TaxID=35708 RepID=A0A0A9BCD6_ARUDO
MHVCVNVMCGTVTKSFARQRDSFGCCFPREGSQERGR